MDRSIREIGRMEKCMGQESLLHLPEGKDKELGKTERG